MLSEARTGGKSEMGSEVHPWPQGVGHNHQLKFPSVRNISSTVSRQRYADALAKDAQATTLTQKKMWVLAGKSGTFSQCPNYFVVNFQVKARLLAILRA